MVFLLVIERMGMALEIFGEQYSENEAKIFC
jgi:hypothetical protein